MWRCPVESLDSGGIHRQIAYRTHVYVIVLAEVNSATDNKDPYIKNVWSLPNANEDITTHSTVLIYTVILNVEQHHTLKTLSGLLVIYRIRRFWRITSPDSPIQECLCRIVSVENNTRADNIFTYAKRIRRVWNQKCCMPTHETEVDHTVVFCVY